jgi:hypothetical protein
MRAHPASACRLPPTGFAYRSAIEEIEGNSSERQPASSSIPIPA